MEAKDSSVRPVVNARIVGISVPLGEVVVLALYGFVASTVVALFVGSVGIVLAFVGAFFLAVAK